MPDVGAFTETEDLATLDSVNSAIETVLSQKRWEFDMRRAQMTLRGRLTGLEATNSVSALSSFAVVRTAGLEQADVTGDYITRLLVTGSTSYSNTAVRVIYAGSILGGVAVTLVAGAELQETISAAEAEFFYAEYILPDTVRNILRVTHQENPLNLEQIDPVIEFDELYPRPSVEFGQPERISVGGFDIATYQGIGNDEPPGLRMIVWPVPDQDYVIDYTYHYRHPELADVDDTLEGVPPEVVDLIVDTAAEQMKAYYEKDYDSLRLSAFTMNKLERVHSRQGGMFADRKPIGNWDGSAGAGRGEPGLVRGRTIGS